jgi:hypothetical protein
MLMATRISAVIDRRYRIAADTRKVFASRQPQLQDYMFRLAAETDRLAACAPQRLLFFVAEKTAPANDVGNLRWHGFLPGFVAAGDALEDVT